jgi:hypothetical protein
LFQIRRSGEGEEKAHRREKISGEAALDVDGEGIPVVPEAFGGVDGVGTAPVMSCVWLATSGAPWFDSNRQTENTRRSDLRAALLARDATTDFKQE